MVILILSFRPTSILCESDFAAVRQNVTLWMKEQARPVVCNLWKNRNEACDVKLGLGRQSCLFNRRKTDLQKTSSLAKFGNFGVVVI